MITSDTKDYIARKWCSGRMILTLAAAASLLCFAIVISFAILILIIERKLEKETIMAMFAALIGPITLIGNWYFQRRDRENGNGNGGNGT